MNAVLADVADAKYRVVRKGLIDAERVLLHSRHFEVGLDAGGRDLGARNGLAGSQEDGEGRRRNDDLLIEAAERGGIAAGADVIELLVINAEAGVDHGLVAPEG